MQHFRGKLLGQIAANLKKLIIKDLFVLYFYYKLFVIFPNKKEYNYLLFFSLKFYCYNLFIFY